MEDAEQDVGRTGRIGQRPQDVEEGAHAELPAHRRDVLHRGVVIRCEHEADAGPGDAVGDLSGIERQADAERLDHVGAARLAADAAPAMLADPGAGGGDHEHRAGRDVEGVGAVAAGADDVDQMRLVGDLDLDRELAHDLGRGGDLAYGLLLGTQAGDQRGGHDGRELAGHDQAHEVQHLVVEDLAVLDDALQGLLGRDGHGGSEKKEESAHRQLGHGQLDAEADEHETGDAVEALQHALQGTGATRSPTGEPGVGTGDGQRVDDEQHAECHEGRQRVPGIGRDELRHESQEEQRDLGIEHIGQEAAPEHARKVSRLTVWQITGDGTGGRGAQQLEADPGQVGRPHPLEHAEGRRRGRQQGADTNRRRQHMDEAAAQDAEGGHDAGAHAMAQRAADDVEDVRAGRQVEQPARRDEHQQLRSLGHGALPSGMISRHRRGAWLEQPGRVRTSRRSRACRRSPGRCRPHRHRGG